MVYTETEKKELDRVRKVFEKQIHQSQDHDLVWSEKVGYVWLAIGLAPLYADTCQRIESAEELCRECLDDIAMDVLFLSDKDHGKHDADSLEIAEIYKRWAPFISQLPEYEHLCGELLERSE